jgi:hypothetical protein
MSLLICLCLYVFAYMSLLICLCLYVFAYITLLICLCLYLCLCVEQGCRWLALVVAGALPVATLKLVPASMQHLNLATCIEMMKNDKVSSQTLNPKSSQTLNPKWSQTLNP